MASVIIIRKICRRYAPSFCVNYSPYDKIDSVRYWNSYDVIVIASVLILILLYDISPGNTV
jgi:hypothetical protein